MKHSLEITQDTQVAFSNAKGAHPCRNQPFQEGVLELRKGSANNAWTIGKCSQRTARLVLILDTQRAFETRTLTDGEEIKRARPS